MILIVDDKAENIFSLKSILELNHFEVDTALSGEEALKKILKNNYALIILDVQMPGMDGFEVAEAISGYNKTKDTPIIFLSAVNTHKKFITKGYASGAIDYITKPVDPDIFILKVKTLYRLYQQTHELNEAHKALQKEMEDRLKAQSALSQMVTELHTTLESLPQIAFTTQTDGTPDFVNKYWFNYSPEKTCLPEVHPDDGNMNEIWFSNIRKGKPFELELRIKNIHNSEYRYHLVRVSPIINEGKISRWVGSFTDINEQKLLNETLEQRVKERTNELQETNKELEASNHDLQQFASVASHDLKEPLRKIQMFSSILKEKQTFDRDTIDSYLDKIILSSGRMSKLINDLLNFSRLSEADAYESTDLNKIISEILVDLELSIQEKKAKILVESLPPIDVIPGLIRQVFQNIISNSLKFAKDEESPVIKISGEKVERLHPESASSPDGLFCRITISDNGIGFNEKYANKIFTLFQRLNAREKYEGTGIGLAIAKKIVDKHNGIILAKSAENIGSTFIIILPVHQVSLSAAEHNETLVQNQ